MRQFVSRFSRRTRILAGAGAALLVILLLLFGGRRNNPAAAFQTAPIKRGALRATVGATGSVRAWKSAVLNWQTGGTVEAVSAVVGDQVAEGQVLARLDPASVSQTIILAEADLVEAQRALEDLLGSDTARAEALIALKDAQDAYEKAYNYRVELNGIGWFKKVIIRTVNHQQVAEIKWYRGYADPETIANADDALALRKAQLDDAQRTYDRVADGPNRADVAAAEARVAAARATLNMARIIAPFAGTVTQAEASPGESAAGSATIAGDQVMQGDFAFRVDDLSRLMVDVQISEVDINSVKIDQAVELSFDAILEQEYHGTVVEVGQAGDTVEGAVTFGVTVELTDADEQVKPGMTAAVNIVVTELQEVLLVPNRAVRLVENQRVVYVLRDGAAVPVEVRLGQSSDQDSVVLGGELKEGELVILNPPSMIPGPFGG